MSNGITPGATHFGSIKTENHDRANRLNRRIKQKKKATCPVRSRQQATHTREKNEMKRPLGPAIPIDHIIRASPAPVPFAGPPVSPPVPGSPQPLRVSRGVTRAQVHVCCVVVCRPVSVFFFFVVVGRQLVIGVVGAFAAPPLLQGMTAIKHVFTVNVGPCIIQEGVQTATLCCGP